MTETEKLALRRLVVELSPWVRSLNQMAWSTSNEISGKLGVAALAAARPLQEFIELVDREVRK